MGRGGDDKQQHKGFIRVCENEGWLEQLSKANCEVNGIGSAIEEYFNKQVNEIEYLHSIRHGLPIFILSRWLDEYIGLFQSLDQRTVINISFLSPRADGTMSGGGYDAPPLIPALGIGVHWVLRELVRKQLVTTKTAKKLHPFCYHPVKSVREFISRMNCSGLDDTGHVEQSRLIHSFLVTHLGEDKATFMNSFDLPFLFLETTNSNTNTLS